MFIVLEIGFFSLVLLLCAGAWLMSRSDGSLGWRRPPVTQARYKSEFAELTFKGTDTYLVEQVIRNDHDYAMARIQYDSAVRITQTGLTLCFVFICFIFWIWVRHYLHHYLHLKKGKPYELQSRVTGWTRSDYEFDRDRAVTQFVALKRS